MPRNSSGVYSLASAAFSPNTIISSAAVNADFNDIATALTQSLATTGVSTMTGPILASNGTAAAPGYTFTGSTTTGMYLAGTNQIGFTTNGSQSFTVNSNSSVTFNNAVSFTGNVTGVIPVGAVVDFASPFIPALWYLCFGQAVSRTTFSALFTAIGTTYGAGDGSTTFNLPDYRGRVLAGLDSMGGVAAGRIGTVVTDSGTIVGTTLGSTGGSSTHVQATGELATHSHSNSLTDPGHTHTLNNAGALISNVAGSSYGGGGVGAQVTVTVNSNTTGITITNANTGSSTAMAWLQPTIMANKIIYAGV